MNARFGTGTSFARANDIFFKAGIPRNKIHHLGLQKASKSVASKYSHQQSLSNCSGSVVKSLPP